MAVDPVAPALSSRPAVERAFGPASVQTRALEAAARAGEPDARP